MDHDPAAETILVVDGDVIARSVIAAYLRDCGYRVLEAGTGAEARAALERGDVAIGIVLADIALPGGLSGFELARWIRVHRPEVKVLLAGAIERAAQAAGDLCEEGPDLAKPYDARLIVDHIRRLRGG